MPPPPIAPAPIVAPASANPLPGAAKAAPNTLGGPPNATQSRAGGPVSLNFQAAEIDAVARTMAVITGRNVVVDPRVKGVISLVTTSAVSPAQALRLFSLQLRTQGFALVDSSGLYLVVPEADAKLQSGGVSVGAVKSSGGQIQTQIFKLNHETANNLVPVLRPLISPNNTINVNPGNNSLIITDYADNLQRIGTIIASLDMPNATGVEIIRLQHSIASDLAPLVSRLIDSGVAGGAAAGQADTAFRTTLLAEPRSNSLILRAANPARLALVRTLVEKLDQGSFNAQGASKDSASGNIYVVYLKNADATKLAATLRAALAANNLGAAGAGTPVGSPAAGGAAPGGASAAATAALSSAQPSTGGQIQADPATNSLIITAPEPQYRQLRSVIDKLDARRAQVFVESLIAEVNADKAAEFSIQFQGPVGKKGDGAIGLLGSNFNVGGTNIITLSRGAESGASSPSSGGNFGVVARQSNGVYALGFLARILESSGEGNVLSTPNLLTLDNEEARIVVGRNVPFVTGQFTSSSSSSNSGSVNPFQTIERKDVGLILRVKPQISEDGSIKLQVFQEVSSLDPATVNSPNGPTTNKRSIESNVVVEDGAIVVLGGLLTDEYSGGQEKVPFLGDLPVLGNFFKGEARSRKKSNLMVFLRPVVVRDAASTESLSQDRYDFMRGEQQMGQPIRSSTVPVNQGPILPALPDSKRETIVPNPSQPPQTLPAQPKLPVK
jgi:general secretion pathway protein D